MTLRFAGRIRLVPIAISDINEYCLELMTKVMKAHAPVTRPVPKVYTMSFCMTDSVRFIADRWRLRKNAKEMARDRSAIIETEGMAMPNTCTDDNVINEGNNSTTVYAV